MKDQDLRAETAQRKRARKRAQRRAGVPTYIFQPAYLEGYQNRIRREDRIYQRLRDREAREAARHRVVPVSQPKKRVVVGSNSPRLLGAVLLLAASGALNHELSLEAMRGFRR